MLLLIEDNLFLSMGDDSTIFMSQVFSETLKAEQIYSAGKMLEGGLATSNCP